MLRGAAQLLVVGLLLRGAISDPWWVAPALAVMSTIAIWTAGGRTEGRPLRAVALATVTGVGVAVGVIFGSGMLGRSPSHRRGGD